MSFKRAEEEKKRNRWIEAIWTVLCLFGRRADAIKSRYKSELEEETEEEEKKKRNESDLEREYEMAE
jgi:hypothetical protein